MKILATSIAIVAALAISAVSASASKKHDRNNKCRQCVWHILRIQLDRNNKCWVKRDSVPRLRLLQVLIATVAIMKKEQAARPAPNIAVLTPK